MEQDKQIERDRQHWARLMQVVGETHTARLARGAARLAADLDVPADVAGTVLGATLDVEVQQMLREGRY